MSVCIECNKMGLTENEESGKVCFPCESKMTEEQQLQIAMRRDPTLAAQIDQEMQAAQEYLLEYNKMNCLLLTTEAYPAGLNIEKRIDIVSSEVVYGVNVIDELFAGVTNFIGGRSGTLQNQFKKGRMVVLTELRKEAYSLGANAVIGVSIQYLDLGGGKTNMIMVTATGTAVIVPDLEYPSTEIGGAV